MIPATANQNLNLLVFGATGGTGQHVVRLGLEAGHAVTAVVRKPSAFSMEHKNLRVVQGDVMQPQTFQALMSGKDAVISALGVRSRAPTTLFSGGTANILEAMKKTGGKRFMGISAVPVELGPELALWQRLVTKYILQRLLKHVYADLRTMEELLRKSDVDWTVVRPPMLTNKPFSGKYRTATNSYLAHPVSIARADLAYYMVNHIQDSATYRAVVEIAY